MRLVEISRAAEADLEGIFDHSVEHYGEAKAVAYLRALQESFLALADRPAMGQAIDWVRTGYRRLGCESHGIFYIIEPERIRIIRVLHNRMDPIRHL